jgi:hypothetical protein
MFKPNTVFVIGAAASFGITKDGGFHSDFPLGSGLKTKVARALTVEVQKPSMSSNWEPARQSSTLYRAIYKSLHVDQSTRNSTLYTSIIDAGRSIMNGVTFSPSIDNFLHSRRDNPLISACIKAAIVKIILDCEKKCRPLHWPGHHEAIAPTQFDGAWHQIFAEICFAGAEPKQIQEALDRVTIISFNYDRCFEQFIRIALWGMYGLTFQEIEKEVSNLKIYYPYGSLGQIADSPFGGPPGDTSIDDLDPDNFTRIATSIRTFTESAEGDEDIPKIKTAMAAAQTIVFLGFGYAEQNIDLLTPTLTDSELVRNLMGTALGLSDAARKDVQAKLANRLFDKIQRQNPNHPAILEDMRCYEFMTAYRHSMSI